MEKKINLEKENKDDSLKSFKNSIFISLNSSKDFWKKCNKLSKKSLPIYGESLYKKGKIFKNWVKRYFVLTNKFFNSNNDSEYRFSFKFIKNEKTFEIFTNNSKIFYVWKKFLKEKCIQTDFFENYSVKKEITEENFSKVTNLFLILQTFFGVHKLSGEFATIKIFSKKILYENKKWIENTKNEINLIKQFNSPHLLKLNEVYEGSKNIYLVFEYYDCVRLFDRLSQGLFTLTDIQSILYNLLEGVAYLHTKGVMHRDIQPDTILISSETKKKNETNCYSIKLTDFGLAMKIKQKNNKKILFKRCGTPGFVAPEVLKYEDKQEFYNEKCDVFSVGAIFYAMLNDGVGLFKGKNSKEILSENKKGVFDSNFPEFQNLSNSVISLLRKLLDLSPVTRISAYDSLKSDFFLKKEEDSQIFFKITSPSSLSAELLLKNNSRSLESTDFDQLFVFQNNNKIPNLISSKSISCGSNSRKKSYKKSNFSNSCSPSKKKDQFLSEISVDNEELHIITKREKSMQSLKKNKSESDFYEDINEDKDIDEAHLEMFDSRRSHRIKSFGYINSQFNSFK